VRIVTLAIAIAVVGFVVSAVVRHQDSIDRASKLDQEAWESDTFRNFDDLDITKARVEQLGPGTFELTFPDGKMCLLRKETKGVNGVGNGGDALTCGTNSTAIGGEGGSGPATRP
jgi:hypothetical protein